jgi:hypothetical protein
MMAGRGAVDMSYFADTLSLNDKKGANIRLVAREKCLEKQIKEQMCIGLATNQPRKRYSIACMHHHCP